MDRIATYLDEEEVDGQVSSLKKEPSTSSSSEHLKGLGIQNGSFKWNAVKEESKDDKTKGKDKKVVDTPSNGGGQTNNSNGGSSDETDTVVADTGSVTAATAAEGEAEEIRFELKDISVMFPEGELTVVTGPTASGKTAILVSHFIFF